MPMSLELSRTHVQELLRLAEGNAEAVYRAIGRAEAASRERGWDDAEAYPLMRLALADLTGNASYRL